jgi:hypothetical protein
MNFYGAKNQIDNRHLPNIGLGRAAVFKPASVLTFALAMSSPVFAQQYEPLLDINTTDKSALKDVNVDDLKDVAALFKDEASYDNLVAATVTDAQLNTVMGKLKPPVRPNNARLLPGEFYTAITLINKFQDGLIIASCGNNKLASNYAAATFTIDYIGPKGSPIANLIPQTPLFSYADPTSQTPTAGCVFSSAPDQSGPYVIYSGFGDGQEGYNVHFVGTAGKDVDGSAFTNIAKLALAAAAVVPVAVPIAGPVSALITTVAPAIDALVSKSKNAAFSRQYLLIMSPAQNAKKAINYPNGYFASVSSPYWLPKTKGDPGGMLIYQRKSSSIIIDANPNKMLIRPDDILANRALGSPHACIASIGTCPKEDLFEKTLGASFDLYGDFKTLKPAAPADATDKWAAAFTVCEKIRATAINLGLSPIDALLARWAMLNKNGLFEALDNKDYADAIKATTRVGVTKVQDLCWDDNVDTQALNEIAMLTGKTFSPD